MCDPFSNSASKYDDLVYDYDFGMRDDDRVKRGATTEETTGILLCSRTQHFVRSSIKEKHHRGVTHPASDKNVEHKIWGGTPQCQPISSTRVERPRPQLHTPLAENKIIIHTSQHQTEKEKRRKGRDDKRTRRERRDSAKKRLSC